MREALVELAAQGYDSISISGGEPLLYSPLRQCLAYAKELGMQTAVTTNGLLLDRRKVEMLADHVDVLAISVDGKPESHDYIRGAEGSFERLVRRLELVREADIPFGFIFTLTQYNLDELPWVARFALEQGAGLLQVHPVEEAGRAKEDLPDHAPDEQECAVAIGLIVELQHMVGDGFRFHIDLCDRLTAMEIPSRVYAEPTPSSEEIEGASLADLLSPLIIEPDGELVPLQFGFPRAYALGRLGSRPVPEMVSDWKRGGYLRFRELAARVFGEIQSEDHPRWFNWYAQITEAGSRRHLPQVDPSASSRGAPGS